jgi:Acetoacetate decarboxylase (ADC)
MEVITWQLEGDLFMLKGFNYPLTPKGKSTLNPPPSWYYSAGLLNIEFWADPSVVPALLPPGLETDRAAKGHCNALFYDWQFSGDNHEYLDPAGDQYREFFILVVSSRWYALSPGFHSCLSRNIQYNSRAAVGNSCGLAPSPNADIGGSHAKTGAQRYGTAN